MKISLNWLKEYLGDIKDKEKLLANLTSIGLEVDNTTKLKKDTIIDIDMTPNRADCLSVIGIARDVGTIYKRKVSMPRVSKLINNSKSYIKSVNKKISTSYSVLAIEDFDNTITTPKYISERLKASGVSEINFIVDVLNYVMLEIGQPMHVFDRAKLDGKIMVRFAKKGEKINALDGKDYSLSPDVPVIADNIRPQAIAGVIGSNDSSVNKGSKSIIIESAFFDQNLIRKASKKYRLQTESSYRFERGVDPLLNNYALGRVLSIIKEYTKVKKYNYSHVRDKNIASHIDRTINMEIDQFENLLGEKISQKFIINTLVLLGFNPTMMKKKLKIKVPSYRFDIAIAQDLVEEVARIYGYNNLSGIALPLMNSSTNTKDKKSIDHCLDLLSSRGYNELITFSFLPKESQNSYYSENLKIDVLNPISEDKSEMRVTMMHGLLKTAKYNISRQNNNIRFYETGKTYKKHRDNKITEENVLAGLISGTNYESNLKKDQQVLDFYDLKGDLMSILPGLSFMKESKLQHLSPICQAFIIQNKTVIGHCGEPSQDLYKRFNIKAKIYYFEINIDLLKSNQKTTYKSISIYPRIQRDLTFLVDDGISGDKIIDAIQRKSFNYMINSRISDIFYNSEELGNNKKSITVELVFQHNDRTLLDNDINDQISLIIRYLEDKYNATVRN